MSDGRLSTYTEFATLVEQLPILIRERRRAKGLSLRDAGLEIGVSFSTVTRMESGGDASTVSLVAVLRWLDRDPSRTPTGA